MSIQQKIVSKRKEIVEKRAKRKAVALIIIGLLGGIGWTYSVFTLKMLSDELFTVRTITISNAQAKTSPEAESVESSPLCGLKDVVCEGEYPEEANFTTYNAEVGQTDADPYTMASGRKVYEGAVANNCLSIGSRIQLETGEILTVEDRMNKRYDCDHFDVFKWDKKDNFKKDLKFKKI